MYRHLGVDIRKCARRQSPDIVDSEGFLVLRRLVSLKAQGREEWSLGRSRDALAN